MTQVALCIYFRLYKEEGHHRDDDIFRAVYLQERTAEKFIRGICGKSSIDSTRVKELIFLDTDGIIDKTNDEVLRKMPNEHPLNIEFIELCADSVSTENAVDDLKMWVHI